MIRRTNPRNANGHAGPAGRPNGHDPASVERGGVTAAVCPADSRLDHAASDDASGTPVACASASSVASLPSQASTDRKAYAVAAPPLTQSSAQEHATGSAGQTGAAFSSKNAPSSQDQSDDRSPGPTKIPGGTIPLPPTVNEFVEEIHRRVDLFEVWQSFLRHPDDKLRQRSVERLTDLRYKGTATSDDEPQQIIWDLPRPKRD